MIFSAPSGGADMADRAGGSVPPSDEEGRLILARTKLPPQGKRPSLGQIKRATALLTSWLGRYAEAHDCDIEGAPRYIGIAAELVARYDEWEWIYDHGS